MDMEPISEDHPLQQLFLELVGRHYAQEIGIRDDGFVLVRPAGRKVDYDIVCERGG